MNIMDVESVPEVGGKKVSFALDVKPDNTEAQHPVAGELQRTEPVDGVIGQLEVYKSGAVKIRLANGILLDVRVSICSANISHKHVG
jgi:DNA-directed RNA polymerase III subunit RPC4